MFIKKGNPAGKVLAIFVAIAFIGSGICLESFAQVQTLAAETAAPVGQEIKETLPVPGNVTVNFKEVDIKTVLLYLSEVSDVDIVPSPGVDAMITMRLRDKPWEVALDIVTRNYGYVYSREGDIIRVMPKGQMQMEEPMTDVIPLNYVVQGTEDGTQNITQLIAAIDSVIVKKAGEKATFLSSANAIVVTAIPARVGVIKDMVSRVDRKTPQIMLEAKIIEVTLDRNDQFGVDWNTVISAAGARRPTTFPFQNDGIIKFLPNEQRKYFPPGSALGAATLDSNVSFGGGFPPLDMGTLIDPNAAAIANSIFSYGTLDLSTFTATLRLIDEWDRTNVISSPRITTLNNQPAVIKVVQNVYLQKQQKSTDTATVVTVAFETTPKEIGVILEVTPHINDRGEITVDLKPQVSSTLNFEELQVSNSQNTVAMTYNLREADTQVMVKDSETIFIGGLIMETTTKEEHKFPILGDLFGWIPVIGGIFKYEQDNTDKTEVVFFITVHLLKDGMHSIEASRMTEFYEKVYPEDEDSDSADENDVKVPVVKTGKLKVTEKEELIQLPSEAVEEKKYKPFLDFRK